MNFADPQLFVANSAAGWLALNDPIKNIAVTVHQYNGLGSTVPNVLSATCAGVVAWARGHDLKVHVGEIAIDAAAPLDRWRPRRRNGPTGIASASRTPT